MSLNNNSPLIKSMNWGKVKVENYDQEFKDVKLFPGGARVWDWGETGTSHSSGIQPEDVVELLEKGSEIVILSRGVLQRLKISKEAIRFLEERNIEYKILSTNKAVDAYNDLCKTEKKVGALIHSTC